MKNMQIQNTYITYGMETLARVSIPERDVAFWIWIQDDDDTDGTAVCVGTATFVFGQSCVSVRIYSDGAVCADMHVSVQLERQLQRLYTCVQNGAVRPRHLLDVVSMIIQDQRRVIRDDRYEAHGYRRDRNTRHLRKISQRVVRSM